MKLHALPGLIAAALLAAGICSAAADLTQPNAIGDPVFEEVDGVLAVEAEHFYRQTLTSKRAWHVISASSQPGVRPDADPAHLAGASGGAYVEVLPDTRATHDDPLIDGENFSGKPGALAVLSYKVHFNNPGRYYVWVRAYATGTEDNGVHAGLDGQWPESGQRWQTVQKNGWSWDSKQRTQEVHVGEPWKLYLDIERPGAHEIQFSMREDGFEMDKFVLARGREFKPEGQGPAVRLKSGRLPRAFPVVGAAVPAQGATSAGAALLQPRGADGTGRVDVSGERKRWHNVTLTLDGPFAHERDNDPNPFTDYNLTVTFAHESGSPRYAVPGYFAADGAAGSSSAQSGTKWRAHLSPDREGTWTYQVSFTRGKHAALEGGGQPVRPFDGVTGRFRVAKSDKRGRDFRAHGRLQYVGGHYLRFAGSKEYFLKAGADSPETLLGSADFDGTEARKLNVPLKRWQPHLRDWRSGDPTWRDGRGKGLIGALNYLASTGCNGFSFLTYNAGGDGDNVWPFVSRDDKLHYDCSKLDQWGIVFDHATALGLYCHFKLQETENDDQRLTDKRTAGNVPQALDGGGLGPERKLYLRELIARYGHLLALNWNLGEENTQTPEEQRTMSDYLARTDPYGHHRVVHTHPGHQDQVYVPLLGDRSSLTGASLQNAWNQVHQRTLQWLAASARAGKPWVVANDEQGSADTGVPPDLGYRGYAGKTDDGKAVQSPDDIRKYTLWANLMAGGAGVEYYFGYRLPENDLVMEDFRSRHQSWTWASRALGFFREHRIPFWELGSANALIGNPRNTNDRYCLARTRELYLVYLPNGGSTELDLGEASGSFALQWFNPREGGSLPRTDRSLTGGGKVMLTAPSSEDWLAIVRLARPLSP